MQDRVQLRGRKLAAKAGMAMESLPLPHLPRHPVARRRPLMATKRLILSARTMFGAQFRRARRFTSTLKRSSRRRPAISASLPRCLRKCKAMFLAKVVGTVWSTKKTPDLEGVRFLVVHPYDLDKEPTRNIVVVADRLGAGTGEMVLCAFGKAARSAIGNQDMAIEAAVVGIVDRVDITDTASEEVREAAVKLAGDNGRP